MAASVTKKREGGAWRIHIDGRRTSLYILKGDAPRYREPQDYDLMSDPDTFQASGRSVWSLMRLVELIATEAQSTKIEAA